MTLLPLDRIRLDAHSHVSALRWVGVLYCHPRRLAEAEQSLSRTQRAAAVLRIYFHALPYLVLVAVLGRWFLLGLLGLQIRPESALVPGWAQGVWFHASQLAVGLVVGLVFGLVVGLVGGLVVGLVGGLVGSLGGGLVFGLVGGLGSGLVFGLVVSLAFSLAVGLGGSLVLGLGGSLVLGLIGVLGGGLATGLGIGFGYLVGLLRLYYLPLHAWFLWPRVRAEVYHFHPVAWDDVCLLSFPALDRLLVRYAEHDPARGGQEIDRLIDEYPSQRGAALRARAILVARRAAAATDLARLDEFLVSLPVGEKGFLKETPELRRRAHEIAALQARLDTLNRPFLREPYAALLVKEIESFEQQIAGFTPPLSTEFRKAARRWLEIARRQLDAARAAAGREPTTQVFRAGDPVDREREAFVQRGEILGELERQVMLATGCPGLLLYGRRRMGKSTLLRNLEGFLPPQVKVAGLSMQEAQAFTGLPELVGLIGRRVAAVLPDGREPLASLVELQRFLDAIDERLKAADERLLLTLDEYEYLDHKIGQGVLPEDLLAVLRESIQTHRRIVWTFAGTHAIDELAHAPWTSYLVSARTVEVPPFEPAETRLLLTEPLKHSSLWRATDAEPPRFEPGFWGDGGIERIHAEAGGWPHLVQLVAETVVDLVNDAGGTSVDDALFERALDRAVVRGNNVMLELVEKESRLPGEWDYLRAFRRTEEQPVPEDEAVARSLRRRRLVVEEDGRYRLRVPLMGRWLRQRV